MRRFFIVIALVNMFGLSACTIRSFPSNLTAIVFGYKAKPNFTVENEKEISTAPKAGFAPVLPKIQGVTQVPVK